MDRPHIVASLTAVFHDVFDDDGIVLSDRMTADDVDGWDSLAHIRLIVSAEQVFGLRFTTAEVTELRNVGDFIDLIRRKLG